MDTELPDPPQSLADLLFDLGDIPPERVRRRPSPGTATIKDLLLPGNRSCELVDGILVEKAMALNESLLATVLIELLSPFIRKNNLGILSGEQGPYELTSGLVRLPDVAFASWDRLPGRRRPTAPIQQIVPDLAIEVLSTSNTKAEMARKRREYFEAGVVEVWEVDPRARSLRVYSAAESGKDFVATDSVTMSLIPGFTLQLAELFAELDRQG